MSRIGFTWPRRTRSVWDRPAADTRLLLTPFPPTVSPGPSPFPRGSSKPSAPSRLLSSGVTREPHLTLPPHPDVDARGFPRKDPTCAHSGVRMDACFDSLQMFPRLTPASAPLRRGCLPRLAADVFPTANPLRAFPSAVDARAFARRYVRNALPGLAKIARLPRRAIAHVPAPDAPAYADEGALATSSFSSSSSYAIPSLIPSTELEAEVGAFPPTSASVLLSPSPLKALRACPESLEGEREIKGVRLPRGVGGVPRIERKSPTNQ